MENLQESIHQLVANPFKKVLIQVQFVRHLTSFVISFVIPPQPIID